MIKYCIVIDKIEMFLIFLLISMHQFFYLVPSRVFGLLYDYYLFGLATVIVIYSYRKYKKDFFCGYFRSIIISIPLIIVLSSMMASLNYGQSILSGLFTQRAWFITMLLYFPLVHLIRSKKLTLVKLEKALYFIVAIELFVYFMQFFIGADRLFLHVNSNIRYNSLRLYCNTNYMFLIFIIALQKIMKKEKVVVNIIYVIGVISYILLVNKGRGIAFVFFVGAVVLILLSKSEIIYKFIILTISGITGIKYLLKSKSVQEFVAIIISGKKDTNYLVRLNSQEYFLKRWNTNLFTRILGYGYPNSNSIISNIATGANQGYLLADNGMVGYLMCYGLLGIAIYIIYIYKLFVLSVRGIINNRDPRLLAILISIVVGISTSGGFFITFYSFETVLIMIYAEVLILNTENEECSFLEGLSLLGNKIT